VRHSKSTLVNNGIQTSFLKRRNSLGHFSRQEFNTYFLMILPIRYRILIILVILPIPFIFSVAKIENQNKGNKKAKTVLTKDDLRLLEDISATEKPNRKIIISVNKGGPNNQIWGLREGLFLSHLLGREFVPPLFFRHYTTKGHFNMNPEVFIDLDNLSRLESYLFIVKNLDKKNLLARDEKTARDFKFFRNFQLKFCKSTIFGRLDLWGYLPKLDLWG
jgi:hypothetical protein